MDGDRPGGDIPDEDRYETDRPGQEIDKEHREVVNYLINNEAWRYKRPKGGGYPKLFPPGRGQTSIKVPKTGHTRGRAFSNWISEIRRKGGHWPPERK